MSTKTDPFSGGLHKKGSTYDILNTDDCKLVHKGYDRHSDLHYDSSSEKGASYYRNCSIQAISVI